MKVEKILISVLACSITFLSCSSTKQSEYSYGDSYYDSTEDINETDEIKGDKIVTSDNKNSIKKKKANSFFSFGNKDDFIIGDEFTLFTKGTFGGITQKDAQFMISVDDLNSGFGSAYMAAYYILTMDEISRQKFIDSFNRYCSDFENKKLNRKGSKTYKIYGSTDVHLDWGTIKTSTPNNADAKALLGYEFQNKSPYFTITIFPVHNNHYDIVGDSTSKESLSLKYFFTKSQALQLCSFLEQKITSETMDVVNADEY